MTEELDPTIGDQQNLPAKKEDHPVLQLFKSGKFKESIAQALPKHLTPDRMARVAITATMRNPGLLKCTPESLVKAMMDCSSIGVEPDGRLAHLIPYGQECQLIVDYKGLVELAMRSGTVAKIHADVVCDIDKFEVDTGEISHRINYRQPRGAVYAVYCIVTMKDGSTKSEVMTIDEVEKVRARSKASKKGPWVTDWNEMAKKTVFRRTSKWLTLSSEFRDAVDRDGDRFADAPFIDALDVSDDPDPTRGAK